MLHVKKQLSDACKIHDIYWHKIRYIAYFDEGVWYRKLVTRGVTEYLPFDDQGAVTRNN